MRRYWNRIPREVVEYVSSDIFPASSRGFGLDDLWRYLLALLYDSSLGGFPVSVVNRETLPALSCGTSATVAYSS